MFLSVIIPAYNEENRIGKTLSGMEDYLKSQNYDYEVIVVDDGSKDNMVSKAEESGLAIAGKLKVVKNGINRGKGFSVKNGISNSKGEYIRTGVDLLSPGLFRRHVRHRSKYLSGLGQLLSADRPCGIIVSLENRVHRLG